jgi:hypothetical protein
VYFLFSANEMSATAVPLGPSDVNRRTRSCAGYLVGRSEQLSDRTV